MLCNFHTLAVTCIAQVLLTSRHVYFSFCFDQQATLPYTGIGGTLLD